MASACWHAGPRTDEDQAGCRMPGEVALHIRAGHHEDHHVGRLLGRRADRREVIHVDRYSHIVDRGLEERVGLEGLFERESVAG